MFILKIVLIVVEVVCSLLLIGLVLMQKSRGEGLGMAFGAEMGESLFGARAGNVLTKATVWLTAIFLINTTILAKIYTQHQGRSLMDHVMPSAAPIEQAAPPVQHGPALPATVPSPYSETIPTEQQDVAPAEVSAPETESQDVNRQ